MQDPKPKREFSDFSDYPQNGFGDIDQDYFLKGNISSPRKRKPEEDQLEDPTEDCWDEDYDSDTERFD